MNYIAIKNIADCLLESLPFVNMYGKYPLDKETLNRFLSLQSRLKHEFNALDIETDFANSNRTEAVFYVKKLDKYLYMPANVVKKMLIRHEEFVRRRNILIEKLKNENEEPAIVHYEAEVFQMVIGFRYEIEKYADSIITNVDKLHQILNPSKNDGYHIPIEYQSLIDMIYQELFDNYVFDINENIFRILIENADFSEIYNKKKTQIAYTIYILSKLMGGDWYEESAKSINLTKTRCSGANVEDWAKNLSDKIEKEKRKIDKANKN